MLCSSCLNGLVSFNFDQPVVGVLSNIVATCFECRKKCVIVPRQLPTHGIGPASVDPVYR